jgi:hypothetical protein
MSACYDERLVELATNELVRRRARAMRILLVAWLSVLVALGGAAPSYARLAFGDADHVCHCDARGGHAECACPRCFPELEDGLFAADPSVRGKCGDDDAGWRTLSQPACAEASSAPVVALVVHDDLVPREPPLASRSLDGPDPRPPRDDRAA